MSGLGGIERLTKSEQIRRLADEGLATTEIARRVGVRYQHAYNVLREAGKLPSVQRVALPKEVKPVLKLDHLLARGFSLATHWVADGDVGIRLAAPVTKAAGVYAFSVDGVVQYVGVATIGLAKRLYLYGHPGPTQTTSIRLKRLMRDLLNRKETIEIAIATPSDLDWNGLPVHSSAGLELGLIKSFDLPWNKRSSN